MRDMYYIVDEDGLSRMFDVSHDGLEDAIEAANEAGVDVLRDRDGMTETVWSCEDADSDEPWDGFNSRTRKRTGTRSRVLDSVLMRITAVSTAVMTITVANSNQ